VDIVVDIAVIIVCLSVAFLSIYIVTAIRRSRETLERLETSLESVDKALVELNDRLAPVLEDARVIAAKLRVIAGNVSDEIGVIKIAAQTAGDIMHDIQTIEKKIMRTLDNPLAIISTYGIAVFKGLRAFIAMLRDR